MAKRAPRKKKKLEPEEKQNLPYIPLYTGDYIKNTRSLSLEAKGAWVDMILQMWDTKSKGVLIGTIDDFTRSIGSTSSEQTSRIITELAMKRVADVSKDDNNEYFTIICRRLAREAKISEARSKAVQNRYKNGTKLDTTSATKGAQNPENEIEVETESKSDFETDFPYGKSENYFHGPLPEDLIGYAQNIKPSSLDSEAWQRQVQREIQALGYTVAREVACPYPSEDSEEIEGFIDLQATKNGKAYGIELDNRVTTRDSIAKVRMYPAGMVLLRDPKPTPPPSARIKPPPSDTLDDVTFWTNQVIKGNDIVFIDMIRNRGIDAGNLEEVALDHLSLCARYKWHEKMTDPNEFRNSLMKHLKDSNSKNVRGAAPRKEVTIEELKAARNGNV